MCGVVVLEKDRRTHAGKPRSFRKGQATGKFGGVAACMKYRGTKSGKARSFHKCRGSRMSSGVLARGANGERKPGNPIEFCQINNTISYQLIYLNNE